MANILMLLQDSSLNVWLPHLALRLEKSGGHLMVKSLRKLYFWPVPDRATLQKEFRTVPRYAVCISRNMLCCISSKCMEVNPMYSIWISGHEGSSMRSLSEEQLKTMVQIMFAAGFQGFTKRMAN